MRIIATVLGRNRVGIMSLVCTPLAQHNANILDTSQTILQESFTMVMLVDAGVCDIPSAKLTALLERGGEIRSLDIRAQREDIFNTTHRI